MPASDHPDSPALAMLSVLLTGSRTSRLYRLMVVEEQSAVAVSSSTEPGVLYPGLFVFSATPRTPTSTAQLEESLYRELAALAADPPDAAELDRVRVQLQASRIRRLRTNLGLALRITDSQTLTGDWQDGLVFSERMAEVQPVDISAVVRKYFRQENRTVSWISRRAEP